MGAGGHPGRPGPPVRSHGGAAGPHAGAGSPVRRRHAVRRPRRGRGVERRRHRGDPGRAAPAADPRVARGRRDRHARVPADRRGDRVARRLADAFARGLGRRAGDDPAAGARPSGAVGARAPRAGACRVGRARGRHRHAVARSARGGSGRRGHLRGRHRRRRSGRGRGGVRSAGRGRSGVRPRHRPPTPAVGARHRVGLRRRGAERLREAGARPPGGGPFAAPFTASLFAGDARGVAANVGVRARLRGGVHPELGRRLRVRRVHRAGPRPQVLRATPAERHPEARGERAGGPVAGRLDHRGPAGTAARGVAPVAAQGGADPRAADAALRAGIPAGGEPRGRVPVRRGVGRGEYPASGRAAGGCSRSRSCPRSCCCS